MFFNYRFRDDVKFGVRHPKCSIHMTVPQILITSFRSLKTDEKINKDPPLPKKVDLAIYCDSQYIQGNILTCVCNIICVAIKMKLKMKNESKFFAKVSIEPSRLYIYNISRINEDTTLYNDSNCMIESALDTLCKYNFCDESKFEYNQTNLHRFPDLSASLDASHNNNKFKYNKLEQSLDTIKTSLLQKNPVILGIVLFESFNRRVNGLLITPDTTTEKVLGSCTILLIGYDDDKNRFKFVNCYSTEKEFGYIMYDYILNPDITGDIYNLI